MKNTYIHYTEDCGQSSYDDYLNSLDEIQKLDDYFPIIVESLSEFRYNEYNKLQESITRSNYMKKFKEFTKKLNEVKQKVTTDALAKSLNLKADKNGVFTLTQKYNDRKVYLQVSDAYNGSINYYSDYDGKKLDGFNTTYITVNQAKKAMSQSGVKEIK